MRDYKSQIPEKAASHFKQNQSETSASGAFAQESTSNVMKYHKKTVAYSHNLFLANKHLSIVH